MRLSREKVNHISHLLIKAMETDPNISLIKELNTIRLNIVGIINIYDILFSKGDTQPLADYIDSPYFVNDTDAIDVVLSNLRKKKKPMAVVINKENKCVGILTMEDILEEIVGEIGG